MWDKALSNDASELEGLGTKRMWFLPCLTLSISLQLCLLENNILSCTHRNLDSGVHVFPAGVNLLMLGFFGKLGDHPQDQESNLHIRFCEDRTAAFL